MNGLMQQFKDVVSLFGCEETIQLGGQVFLKYQDVFNLFKSRGYITVTDISTLSRNIYLVGKKCELGNFESWLKEQIKESNKMKRRDWKIAIVSGVIGAVIGLIPWLVGLLTQ